MKTFSFRGKNIVISDARERYIVLKLVYNSLANEAIQHVLKIYRQYTDLEKAADQLRITSEIVLDSVIKEIVERLVNTYKCYDLGTEMYTREYIMPECGKGYQIFRVCDEIESQYQSIQNDADAIREYRDLRKNMRPRLIGGGFGIQGAAKGVMTAAAINGVVGLGHGMVNSIADLGTNADSKRKKDAVLKSDQTVENIRRALYSDVYQLMQAEIVFIKRQYNLEVQSIYTTQSEKCRNILHNLTLNNTDEDYVIDYVIRCIDLNPYDFGIYEYCIDKFGDSNYEIEKLASFFGMGKMIVKSKVDRVLIGSEIGQGTTQEILMSKKCKINEKMNYLGLDKNNLEVKKTISKIERKSQELDRIDRTFEGVVFEKKEDVAIAKEEKLLVLEITNKIDYVDENNLLSAKQCLIDLNIQKYPIKVEIEKIDNILNEIDVARRSYDGVVFDSVDEVERYRKEKSNMENLISITDYTNRTGVLECTQIVESSNLCLDSKSELLQKINKNIVHTELEKIKSLIEQCSSDSDYIKLYIQIDKLDIQPITKETAQQDIKSLLKEILKDDIVKYNQVKEAKDTSIGCASITILIIGIVASFTFPPAIPIAIIGIVIYIPWAIIQKIKAVINKRAYKRINKFKDKGMDLS